MRKSRGRTKSILLGLALFAAAAAAGAYLVMSRGNLSPRSAPERPRQDNIVKVPTRPKVKIYVIQMHGDQPYLAPETLKIKGQGDLREAAIRELLETNRWEGESKNLIPQGTRLLSLKVKDGIATVNFSREFTDNFNGGAQLEALTIHSIVHTLTQFPEIRRVRFLVEGQKLETLAGHLDISEPVEGDSTLLWEGKS